MFFVQRSHKFSFSPVGLADENTFAATCCSSHKNRPSKNEFLPAVSSRPALHGSALFYVFKKLFYVAWVKVYSRQ